VKVFLDTNVLASAFATRGLCADVLQATLAEHELLVGDVVLVELKKALREKFHVPADVVKETEAFLRQFTVVPKPKKHLDLGIRDPDDEWVVASAVASGADVVVTGDKDLTSLKKSPVDILTPRQFWERLTKEHG
jgi:putative PIN family toxin of toxin-antitoxin system